MLVDSHCHLDYFSPDQQAKVIENAFASGIVGMISVSSKPSQFPQLQQLTNSYQGIWCSVGCHPCHVSDEHCDYQQLYQQANADKRVVAIGETGLDYFHRQDNQEQQEQAFRQHITLARELDLVLIIHNREADTATERILRSEYYEGGKFRAILHCFTGSKRLLALAHELDFYISFAGILTFKREHQLRSIAAEHDFNRILIETDAPFLAPIPKRGQQNQPAYIVYTLECLAAARRQPVGEVGRQIVRNFCQAFKVDQRQMDCGTTPGTMQQLDWGKSKI